MNDNIYSSRKIYVDLFAADTDIAAVFGHAHFLLFFDLKAIKNIHVRKRQLYMRMLGVSCK